jgi:hypothetical protein
VDTVPGWPVAFAATLRPSPGSSPPAGGMFRYTKDDIQPASEWIVAELSHALHRTT